jgi:hypothetical protein
MNILFSKNNTLGLSIDGQHVIFSDGAKRPVSDKDKLIALSIEEKKIAPVMDAPATDIIKQGGIIAYGFRADLITLSEGGTVNVVHVNSMDSRNAELTSIEVQKMGIDELTARLKAKSYAFLPLTNLNSLAGVQSQPKTVDVNPVGQFVTNGLTIPNDAKEAAPIMLAMSIPQLNAIAADGNAPVQIKMMADKLIKSASSGGGAADELLRFAMKS